MNNDQRMKEITQVQAKYIDELMLIPHVVGVGIGMRQRDGEYTNEMCLVVMVDKKLPIAQLDTDSILPTELDGVGIDVQETGDFSA
jgi:hypothetical protein